MRLPAIAATALLVVGARAGAASRMLGFRALQQRCGEPPPSSLSQRLAELTEARLVELTDDGYRYSREGEELVRLLLPLNEFANRWGKRP